MKNLRKVLAVVLVVCLAFSLVAVASAKNLTDYTDTSAVTSKEAVDVMAATGLMAGDGSTAWNPTGTFTREQAAKVVASLLSANAGKFVVSTSSFSDVAKTRWSAPYIEYAVSKGVLSGYGNGKFGPTDPVTGSQMAVMLLKVLGYGKNNEFATNWEINAIDLGLAKGVLSGTADFSAPATREQVAQYVFNILFKTFQVFDKNLEEYKDATAAPLTVAARLLITKPDATANGVAAYKYAVNGAAVTGLYYTDNVIATSFNGTAIADLMDVTKATFVAPANATAFYVNGALARAQVVGNNFLVGDYSNDAGVLKVCTVAGTGTGGTFVAFAPAVGDTVKLIDNTLDGVKNVDKVAVTIKKVAVVDALGTGVTVTAQINGQPSLVNVDLATVADISGTALTVSGYENLAKGDVVLYYTNAAGATIIEKASASTGKINAYTGTTAVTVSGVAYVRSAESGSMTVANIVALGYNKDITFYTDSNGLIVYAAGPVVAPVIADVVLLGAANIPSTGWVAGHVEAKLLFPDGTTKVVTVSNAYAAIDEAAEQNIFYSYTVDAVTGVYTLTLITTAGDVAVSTQTATDIYKNTPDWCQDGTSIGNSASVFLVRTGTAPAYTYTSYIGVANLPTFSQAATVQIVDTNSRTTIAYIMDPASATTGTNTVFFYNLTATYYGETSVGAGDAYYAYTALVNGVETPVKTAVTVATKGLYSVVYNANNVVTVATPVADSTGVEAGVRTYVADSGIIRLENSYYTFTSDTIVYVANADGTYTKKAIGAVASDVNDVFVVFYNTSMTITSLYIVSDAGTETTLSALALTTPVENGTTNHILLAGSGVARTASVNVVNATASVILTGGKTAAQTVTIAGTNGGLVTAGGTATVPTYTVNTTAIAAAGGTYTFTLTVQQSGMLDCVYTVTVVVAGP